MAERAVDDLLLHSDEVAPCKVVGDHRQCASLRVYVAGLVDVALVGVAEESLDPFGSGLLAGDEALGAEDASVGIDGSSDGVDSDDMLRLVVPWAVLLPVGC